MYTHKKTEHIKTVIVEDFTFGNEELKNIVIEKSTTTEHDKITSDWRVIDGSQRFAELPQEEADSILSVING